MRDRVVELLHVPASSLVPNPRNWRTHPAEQRGALGGLLSEVGVADVVLARRLEDGRLMILDGHLRAELIGPALVPVLVLDLSEAEGDALLVSFDPLGTLAGRDDDALRSLLSALAPGSEAVFSLLASLAPAEAAAEGGGSVRRAGAVSESFEVPDVSVLDARAGYWQSRKRFWLGLGIRSADGRSDGVTGGPMA